MKPKAKNYPDIFAYTTALEKYIKKLENMGCDYCSKS